MDYSSEDCSNIFTKGQVQLMRGVLAHQRSGLVSGRTSGLTSLTNESYSVYPNPSVGEFFITASSHQLAAANVEILNMLGEKVSATKYEVQGGVKVDMRSLPNGIYGISTLDKGSVVVHKVVLSR
jgi:hypothetical protein